MPLRPPHLQSSPTLQLCFDRITVRDGTPRPSPSARLQPGLFPATTSMGRALTLSVCCRLLPRAEGGAAPLGLAAPAGARDQVHEAGPAVCVSCSQEKPVKC